MEDKPRELHLAESRDAFVEWAVENAIPIERFRPGSDDENNDEDPFLSYLSGAVSSSSAVLLSEGFHNCGEMMSLHHRIIQHLIVHCGFRIVGSESGMPESRDVADYVSSSDEEYSNAEKERMWKRGLNKMYCAWAEGRELIEWMRRYNAKATRRSEKVAYCGLDIGGFYADWDYPVSKLRGYLKEQLPDFEEEWYAKIRPLLDVMGTTQARVNYQHLLTPHQKMMLGMLMDELVAKLNSHGEELEGDADFEWAKQSAISMQLAANYYRNYEEMLLSDEGAGISRYTGLDGREIAMANNMMWRLNLDQGDTGRKRMVVINHIIHTKTATQYQDRLWGHLVPMGQLVKQMLASDPNGGRLFNIGLVYGSGTFWNKWQKPDERFIDTCPDPQDDGLESAMKQIAREANMPNYFLHWELAPKEAWMYLNEVTTVRENDYFTKCYPLEWNGCVYLDEVSPATPC